MLIQVLISLTELAYKETCENGIDNVDYDIREIMRDGKVVSGNDKSLCDSCTNNGCILTAGIIRKHCDLYEPSEKTMGKLINADDLEPDTEWSDYYDGFTSYSQSQINEAEEIKAIPVERLKDFRNEVMNMNSIAIIQRLDRLIEEVEG